MGKGIKHDTGKLEWSLLPWEQLKEVVEILMQGRDEYGFENWKHLENAEKRLIDANMRHRVSHIIGELIDENSGKRHLAHCIVNDLFLLWYLDQKKPEIKKMCEVKKLDENKLYTRYAEMQREGQKLEKYE